MTKRRLYGGLCCACFILTAAGYMVGLQPHVSAEVQQFSPADCSSIEQARTTEEKRQKVQKAASLEVVWMNGCDPCRRLKVVVRDMKREGYDITLVRKEKDTRGSRRFPSLYYLDSRGGMIRKEVGYQTASHIKQYLRK